MAYIVLQPGEIFEHSHMHDTKTKLVHGSVRFFIGDCEYDIRESDELQIPAGASHLAVNVGSTPAHLDCGFCTAPPPSPPGPVRT